MAKRIIHECDLTKQEFDPKEEVVFTLSITKKGRKGPHKYELSADAAEKLLAQLNSQTQLPKNWSFANGPVAIEEARELPRTLGDLDNEPDDTKFVAEKKKELREAGVINDEEREEPQAGPVGQALGGSGDKCRHLNKGSIQTSMRDSKRFIYRQCKECGKQIPEMTRGERKTYMSGKAPQGVNLKDL